MSNLYETALMIVRVFAGMQLAIGITILSVAILVPIFVGLASGAALAFPEGIAGYLLDFGAASFVGGLTLLFIDKKIARYASKG